MPDYLYRAVHRRPGGTVGPTLEAQIIRAATVVEAIAQARRSDLNKSALGTNAVYVSAPEVGRSIGTLHTLDVRPCSAVYDC
ncbi:hypothetical protein [Methylobacterium pseudosasicola]|uniref:Uncharacterized protein n=1 Tax=Methylobacterium pseudosasicola TaxID=582667 RepID=A0A1I4PSU6_9HYPH|nr:hypothetical protein [Methylobacterium pseudosasicola]SFM30636.1 hypothetical protein SAMN05192568_102629 [Methylobacterium pseudosasicola]